MKDMFGINKWVKSIAPFQGFAFGFLFVIGLHPMLMIAPLRGFITDKKL